MIPTEIPWAEFSAAFKARERKEKKTCHWNGKQKKKSLSGTQREVEIIVLYLHLQDPSGYSCLHF